MRLSRRLLLLFRLKLNRATFAAAFVRDIRLFKRDGPIHAFAHIVDGKSCHRCCCERLDLHACLISGTRSRLDIDQSLCAIERKLDIDMGHWQGMAERDELWRLLSRHNRGYLGYFQDAAFSNLVCLNEV